MAYRLFQIPKTHSFLLCSGATVGSLFAYHRHPDQLKHDSKKKLNNFSSTTCFSDGITPSCGADRDTLAIEAKLLAAKPALDDIFQQHFDAHHIPGLIYGVTLHGKLVMHGSMGSITASPTSRDSGSLPCRQSSVFRIASMSKSFTALAIIQLRDLGLLSLTDPVSKYVPEVKHIAPLDADSPPLTVGHLLTMQGGFPQDDPWGDRLLDMSDQDFSQLLTSGLCLSNPTGTVYEYSNLGYAILGLVIKNVTKMTYQDYITKHIFLPLGMESTFFECDHVTDSTHLVPGYRWEDQRWKEEPMLHDGAFGAMGGILTTLDDFVKYMAFHQEVWQPHPSGVSSPKAEPCRASVREMHFPWAVDGIFFEKKAATPLTGMAARAMTADSKTEEGTGKEVLAGVWSEAYGYGLKSCRDLKGIRWIRHAGGLPGFSSEWRFLPEHGIGLVVFSNRTYCSTGEANHKAMTHLLREGVLTSHIPAEVVDTPTDILSSRSLQLIRCLQTEFDDDVLSQRIFASNFFLDKPKRLWLEDTKDVRHLLCNNNVESIGKMEPENHLRGSFVVTGRGSSSAADTTGSKVKITFTMTPENPPRIQTLKLYGGHHSKYSKGV